jgi:hypothetical protein
MPFQGIAFPVNKRASAQLHNGVPEGTAGDWPESCFPDN